MTTSLPRGAVLWSRERRGGEVLDEDQALVEKLLARGSGPLRSEDAIARLLVLRSLRVSDPLRTDCLEIPVGDELPSSGSGSLIDMQVEGGWTTGRMVERYCKARPFEERRKAPSPFTASRAAQKEKPPAEKRPSQQRSGLDGNRAA